MNRGLYPAWGWLSLVLLCLCLCVSSTWAQQAAEQSTPTLDSEEALLEIYRLNHGDRLSVQVYGEPELSKEYLIGSNGRISFPFIGEVRVSGLTASEVGERLTQELRGSYLIDPKVTVTVVRYRPIYVNGEVKQPGAKDFEPGLTVRQAISLAGGLTDRASPRKIYLAPSGTEGERSKSRKVDLDARLKPGDTITVEESFF